MSWGVEGGKGKGKYELWVVLRRGGEEIGGDRENGA